MNEQLYQRDQRDQRDQEQRGWRQGISKRHRVHCQQCGGLEHERGRHFRPEQVEGLKQRKLREAARAAARRYGTAQDTPGTRQV